MATAQVDVLIAGAGPAGCVAAIVLARAGARVRLIDRATFPREKLCGDSLNPGALAVLRRLDLDAADAGQPMRGMLVTGPGGVSVDARYPGDVIGRTIARRELDFKLLQSAAGSGVEIEERVLVESALLDDARRRVIGLVVRAGRVARPVRARVVIGADGRASRLARGLGLARHPARPRRWAVGAYFENVCGSGERGEMHIRQDRYIGVAPLPGGLTNACVVSADRLRLGDPLRLLTDSIRNERELADRFAAARMVTPPVVLGPLAVECATPGMPGLLLAGDAAGFIDPMTGDGLRFALRGAELTAIEALRALETGERLAHVRLAAARRREFAAKWRFNRALRRLVGSACGVRVAACASRASSWPVSRIIRYAGDLSAV
jgi:menaquinone-9 beta-reductase